MLDLFSLSRGWESWKKVITIAQGHKKWYRFWQYFTAHTVDLTVFSNVSNHERQNVYQLKLNHLTHKTQKQQKFKTEMKLSSFATALATMGLMPFTTSQSGVCFDPNGGSVGPSGQQKDLKNSSKIILFERKGEEQCGCSYVSYDPLICMLDIVTMPLIYHHSENNSLTHVLLNVFLAHIRLLTSHQAQAKCEIVDPVLGNFDDCSSLKINGTDAAINGYPDVQVKYALQTCNYNDNTNKINLAGDSRIEFYHPDGNKPQVSFFNDILSGKELGPGDCEIKEGTKTLTTTRASYYMKSLLMGPSKTESGGPVDDGYCYAYAFNVIDFKYDYGLGDCDVSVSEYSTTFVLHVLHFGWLVLLCASSFGIC